MQNIITLINQNTTWLYTKIYENQIFLFDFWTVTNFIIGSIIFCLMVILKIRYKYLYLIGILIVWEIIEMLVLYSNGDRFMIESLNDQFTDIILGLLGAGFAHLILHYFPKITKFKLIDLNFISSVLTAFLIAFLWVGFYQYHYSRPTFNFPGFNMWAMTLWTIGYFFIIRGYNFYKRHLKKLPLAVIATWITYFIVLFCVEYLGRYIFEIKEVSSEENTPLIFNLVWGNDILHIVYSFAPIIAILVFHPIRKLINSANNQLNY
ncbi:MAG: hypothetical protein A2X64_01735 [Ignavibacteria bacterium GWF2_33_9]|nr:MAG: hypothetical protein A2X64_01735 [Ignavibacteria bacterium GWF2_33_9]